MVHTQTKIYYKMKKISDNDFSILVKAGIVVPRDQNGNIMSGFKVGKEYNINGKAIARCSQDCPTCLTLIKIL